VKYAQQALKLTPEVIKSGTSKPPRS
jgi:hypothetical protein